MKEFLIELFKDSFWGLLHVFVVYGAAYFFETYFNWPKLEFITAIVLFDIGVLRRHSNGR